MRPRAIPTMHEVIRAISRPGAKIHVLNPTRAMQPDRAHPPLVPPAHHTHFELVICFEGEMSFVGYSATLSLKKGDAVVVKPGAWHYESYRCARQPYRVCWMVATPSLANCIFTHYRRGSFRISEYGGCPQLEESSLLKALAREVEEQSVHWRLKARALLTELLVDFDRRTRGARPSPETRELDPVRKLLRIVQTRFREPLQIRSLSKEIGLSADHLSRRFHTTCGVTFKDCLNAIRIHHAQLLLKSGWSVKRTADECGFRDVYYFGRVFKRRCRVSPGQFARDQRRGEGVGRGVDRTAPEIKKPRFRHERSFPL